MRSLGSMLALLLVSAAAHAEILPGFRVETIARFDGFVSSIATDSNGVLYATTTTGWVYRLDGTQMTPVAALPTKSVGNSGLLGMALLDDATAVVHYTTWDARTEVVLDDVVSRVDLATGAETVLKAFACDVEFRDRGASSEHHGGNPTVAPDGSIFVGIGEYGVASLSQRNGWNAGRIWRIDREGRATEFARGLRNPFDLAWDPDLDRLVLSDNGPQRGDEIHVIESGANCGWCAECAEPPVQDAVPPVYVFADTVAPTGLLRVNGANPLLPGGYLLGSFVTRALYYFPSVAVTPVPDPIPIISDFEQFILDVTQAPSGEIYVATAMFPGESAIHRLHVPARGDCNGDGVTNWRDFDALTSEIADGAPHPTTTAQGGDYRGSWGCDANLDGVIDENDLNALRSLLTSRRRSVRIR